MMLVRLIRLIRPLRRRQLAVRRALHNVLDRAGDFFAGPFRRYQPERHYMRGPGPKSRARNGR